MSSGLLTGLSRTNCSTVVEHARELRPGRDAATAQRGGTLRQYAIICVVTSWNTWAARM